MNLIFQISAKIKGIFSKYTNFSVKGTTSHIKIDIQSEKVYKRVMIFKEYKIIQNEIKWLELLSDSGITPKFISINANTICMSYMGENITKENLPSNWKEQIKNISDILNNYNCFHNDIKISDILIKGGKLKLIDFQWATTKGEKIPNTWPKYLSNKSTYDNLRALEKAVENL